MNGAITLRGVAHIVLGDGNFSFTNVISGPGGFVSDAYNHEMIFHAANTYTGPTVIAQGMAVALSGSGSISQSTNIFFGGSDSTSVHLDASGRTDQTLTSASGQTLGGIGAITGNLVGSSGSTIAPAGTNTTIGITTGSNPTGSISASGNVTLGGTTTIKLDGSGSCLGYDAAQRGHDLGCDRKHEAGAWGCFRFWWKHYFQRLKRAGGNQFCGADVSEHHDAIGKLDAGVDEQL